KKLKGTSNNCHRSSGAPNLPTNDSALFSFRFCAVHPKDVRDSQLRQLFEVPLSLLPGPAAAQTTFPPERSRVSFALTAADGSAITEQSDRSKWLVIYFGYTFCPDVCPTTL